LIILFSTGITPVAVVIYAFFHNVKSKPSHFDPAIHEENIIRDAPVNPQTKSTPVSSVPTDVAAAGPAPVPIITLTQPISVQTESGSVTLPSGTNVEFASQLNNKVHVRYLNNDYLVLFFATDLNTKLSQPAK